MPASSIPNTRTLLGDFPADEFLAKHFGREALFLPAAVEGFHSPISPAELAGLACEQEVESRVVTNTGAHFDAPWSLEEGPFDESFFSSLSEEDWTLLVQDVDKWHPEVSALLRLVHFLPRWTIDDIMISYAVPGGSVGPHVDQYDVFLLQAEGTRRWQLAPSSVDAPLRNDTQLKVLKHFEATQEFIARPGDVLYLPPGLAHFGVAEDECLTYSFGFRAPSQASLFSALADEVVARAAGRLQEKVSQPPEHPSRVSTELWQAISKEAQRAFESVLASPHWLGRHLTESKSNLPQHATENPIRQRELIEELKLGRALCKSSTTRFLYTDANDPILFAGGEHYELPGNDGLAFARLLCETDSLDWSKLEPHSRMPHFSVVARLIEWGALVFEDELLVPEDQE